MRQVEGTCPASCCKRLPTRSYKLTVNSPSQTLFFACFHCHYLCRECAYDGGRPSSDNRHHIVPCTGDRMTEPYLGIWATMAKDSLGEEFRHQNPHAHQDTVLAGRSASSRSKHHTLPCKYWSKGCCFKGDKCLWKHGNESSLAGILDEREGREPPATGSSFKRPNTWLYPTKAQPTSDSLLLRTDSFHHHQSRSTPSLQPHHRMPQARKFGPTRDNSRNAQKIHQRGDLKIHEKHQWQERKRPQALPSYVAQEAYQLRQQQQEDAEKYLGDPPRSMDLIQLRMVVPRSDILNNLDEARKNNSVWITTVAQNTIDIHAESMKILRQALKAINWIIHDRLGERSPGLLRLLLKPPTQATEQSRISLVALRPRTNDPMALISDPRHASLRIAASLEEELVAAMDVVLGGSQELELRVNFGHLRVDTFQPRHRTNMSYQDLRTLLKVCALRGGASLETRFVDPWRAEMLLIHLLNSENGAHSHPELVRETCHITFTSDDCDLLANIVGPLDTNPQPAGVRLVGREAGNRLNLITACPDMKYDWNLQVKAFGHREVPEDLDESVMKLKLHPAAQKSPFKLLKHPGIEKICLGDFGKKVSETRLRTAAVVPWRRSGHLVEIGITTVWTGINLRVKPRVHWDVQFYGSHWDSAVNRTRTDMQRKYWGRGMRDVWTGEEESLAGRLESFVDELHDLQVLLEGFS